MTPAEIEAALDAAEAAVTSGPPVDLTDSGYWKVVASVKRDPVLADRYADRIGAIDDGWFRSAAPLLLPMWLGTALAVAGSVVSLVLVGLAYALGDPWNGLTFLAGTVGLLVATHGLGHLGVGAAVGIRFTGWFAFFRRPQPGVKTDYATYLRTPAQQRAWMHAGGAIVTKAIPFLLIPSAVVAGVPWWTLGVLLAIGIGQLVTDALWSTRSSDWSKYRREMAIAKENAP
jgi:hypothetical protein